MVPHGGSEVIERPRTRDAAEVGAVLAAHAVHRMAPFASLRREEACARDRIPGRAEEDLGERNPESPGTETGHHNEYRDLSHAYLPGLRTDAVQGFEDRRSRAAPRTVAPSPGVGVWRRRARRAGDRRSRCRPAAWRHGWEVRGPGRRRRYHAACQEEPRDRERHCFAQRPDPSGAHEDLPGRGRRLGRGRRQCTICIEVDRRRASALRTEIEYRTILLSRRSQPIEGSTRGCRTCRLRPGSACACRSASSSTRRARNQSGGMLSRPEWRNGGAC